MKTLKFVPEGLREIETYYGVWDSATFYQDYLKWQRMPFRMALSWQPKTFISGFIVHVKIADVVYDALREIRDFGGIEFLQDEGYDRFGGCYNPRGKTKGGGTSTHAWGIAVDWCPDHGMYGRRPGLPNFIVEAFTKRGFEWGGSWKIPDGMHFQACKGY